MAQTIYGVLDELRESATSEADKGQKLERLVAAFLRTDPLYASQFDIVWMWQDWPGRDSKADAGIDIVARNRSSGGLVAIQCKFFAPTTTIAKPDIDSFLSASGKQGFAERIIVSTTDSWNSTAEYAIQDQQIPVRRLGLSELADSTIDWSAFSLLSPEKLTISKKKTLRRHQQEAFDAVRSGFSRHERGKLIMACGTGKTFTALRVAEDLVGAGGTALFLVPSISLLSQSLREWAAEANTPLTPLAVCSDRKVTKRSAAANEDISAVDLALPATTNEDELANRIKVAADDPQSMTVIFATYQSIDAVAKSLATSGINSLDLIICDEAHRTTGVTLVDDAQESAFKRVHNQQYLPAARRLYMTATPRIYDDPSKVKADESDAVIASMDDELLYGPEFHRLGFGEAVSRNLLTDYKVLVLAVDEASVAQTFQIQLSEEGELRLDDAAKIVGCWNGLAKHGDTEHSFADDPSLMQRAVAFAGNIKASKKIQSLFGQVIGQYSGADAAGHPHAANVLSCEVRHVDGTFNALERNAQLEWLKNDVPEGTCRILTNARCLSEGVDVPALDAVMFLSPRKSVVDIVQSVGRVMRKTDDKKYGYIILPIGIPAGVAPETALKENRRYAAVWEVLQALRAHDERFDAMVNRIDLTKDRDQKINVIGVGGGADGAGGDVDDVRNALSLTLSHIDEWRSAIYARLVEKVGTRKYWEQWAKDIANIAQRHTTRITALLESRDSVVAAEYERFLHGLRGNLNEGITSSEAIDMLSQHLITRPVFDALFGGYDFAASNPVAQAMERMLHVLDEHSLDNENESLSKFYESVRMRAQGVDTAEGRQKLIVQLYDTFFTTAFKKTVDRLGIVYTPVEIVDFIIKSADDVLRTHFGEGLTGDGVHVLDGFTGTGTFLVRLLQSGLITKNDLARKYANELHANEILLLAYYIAAVNIETTYQDLTSGSVSKSAKHESFNGLILTDTFQSYEDDDRPDLDVFPENNERLERLKKLPITVVIGNPPYSVGQESGNDDNRNARYPALDAAIESTYAARSTASSKRTLYDAYLRAIKWATLRIKDRGVVAFVTNNGFLTANSADGIRLSLEDEFSDIYIFNLRGNRRNAGAEGRPIFEAFAKGSGGSIAGIAVIVLLKDPSRDGKAKIHYAQVDDFMSAPAKVEALVEAGSIMALEMEEIVPNSFGDWRDQRKDEFLAFPPLTTRDPDSERFFDRLSLGLATGRDAWAYNFSKIRLLENAEGMLENYNAEVSAAVRDPSYSPNRDTTRISWNSNLDDDFQRRRSHSYSSDFERSGQYRPFCRQHVYFDRSLTARVYQLPALFPTPGHSNYGFSVTGPGSHYEFSVLATDLVPDLHLVDTGQFFARYQYVASDVGQESLSIEGAEESDGYRRIDNINDQMLDRFKNRVSSSVTKDDIFYYVYGVLHSPKYKRDFNADLRKMLPRIPASPNFAEFSRLGRSLFDLHVGYEAAEIYPLDGLTASEAGGDYEQYRVAKMSFGRSRSDGRSVADRSVIRYNSRLDLSGVPLEAYEYKVGPRSAIEWVMDRYQVRTDPSSGIVNDPNDWSKEVGDPTYILKLIGRVVTVSLRTLEIVRQLPALEPES